MVTIERLLAAMEATNACDASCWFVRRYATVREAWEALVGENEPEAVVLDDGQRVNLTATERGSWLAWATIPNHLDREPIFGAQKYRDIIDGGVLSHLTLTAIRELPWEEVEGLIDAWVRKVA